MQKNTATIVFLYARWCTHCKLVAKTFEKVAEKLKGKASAYYTKHTHKPLLSEVILCFSCSRKLLGILIVLSGCVQGVAEYSLIMLG